MDEIKKILVAIAPSGYTERVFNYAAKLATSLNAELIVANVINSRDMEAVETIVSMGYEVDGDHYAQGVREGRDQIVNDIIKKSSFPAEKVRVIFKIGNPIDELLNIVEKEDVDMIVMGPKGRTNLEYVILGSVAEKIFRRSPIPILSYRDKKHTKNLKKRTV